MTTDSSSRVGRTAVQVSVPAALVAIGSWAARLAGLDLDPGPGVDMPAEVVGAFVTVLTVALALLMNRGKVDVPGASFGPISGGAGGGRATQASSSGPGGGS